MGILDVPGISRSAADARYLKSGIYSGGLSSTRVGARKGLGQVRIGSGFLKLLCVGDSTTWGAQGGTYDATKSFPALLAAQLNSYFAPAQTGFAVAPSSISGSGHTTTTDPRWSAGTGWILSPQGFADGSSWQAPNGTSAALTYTPGVSCDTFDIYWLRNTGLGTIGASVDGGTVTNIATAGTVGIQKTTITATLGSSHVLSLAPSAGQVFVVAVEAYNSTVKSIRVANAGVSSSQSSHWIGTGSFHGQDAIKAYAPGLTFIMLGINDSVAARTSAAFQANIATIATAAAVSGDVVLMSCVPSQTGSGADPVLEVQYQAVTQSQAVTAGQSYIDVLTRFGDWTTANSLGWMYDNKHPKTEGYADIAAVCAQFLRSM